MRNNKKFIIFSLIVFQVFSCELLFGYDVEGWVKVNSPFPKPAEVIVPEKHVATCGAKKVSSKLKVSADGYVANAVVELKDVPSSSVQLSPKKFILDQQNCEFVPHALIVPKGSKVSILNSESNLHNVRAFDEKAFMLFNLAMPPEAKPINKHFDNPGRFLVRCGIHHWMHAFVIVQDHPYYALTDDSGHFKITGIPDGNYTLTVWHESLGEVKTEVGIKNKVVNVVY